MPSDGRRCGAAGGGGPCTLQPQLPTRLRAASPLAAQLPEWYAEKGIDFLTSTRVTAVDVAAKTLTTAGGGAITFDKLVVATGARVRSSSPEQQPRGSSPGAAASCLRLHRRRRQVQLLDPPSASHVAPSPLSSHTARHPGGLQDAGRRPAGRALPAQRGRRRRPGGRHRRLQAGRRQGAPRLLAAGDPAWLGGSSRRCLQLSLLCHVAPSPCPPHRTTAPVLLRAPHLACPQALCIGGGYIGMECAAGGRRCCPLWAVLGGAGWRGAGWAESL